MKILYIFYNTLSLCEQSGATLYNSSQTQTFSFVHFPRFEQLLGHKALIVLNCIKII